jgi:flagellar basal-body rod protein FlgG
MFRALYTAATGMTAQQNNLDNIANNISNASTTGFRRRRMQFQDLYYQNMVSPGAASTQQTTVAAGLQIGLGTRTVATEISQQQGDIQQTGAQLDMAITGNGFFQVRMPSGQIAYTRDGNFHRDANGIVVTTDGNPIEPTITIPANTTNITIGGDGTVSITQSGQTNAQQVGTIQLASFANPEGLNSLGADLFLPTAASGDAVLGTAGGAEGLGTIQQGSLEQANVSVVQEFVDMILAQRSYEANSRVVKAGDEMFQQLNNLGR